MSREWRPGDVAMVKVEMHDEPRIMLRTRDTYWDDGEQSYWDCGQGMWEITDVRPIVVIDPEDAEQVIRLGGLLSQVPGIGIVRPTIAAKSLTDALREFANPTPPKPEEPTGLGAVVEDADGLLWMRWSPTNFKPWMQPDPATSDAAWIDVTAVRVLSPGVEAAS